MTIRRAVIGDAALLAEHRAAVWHEVGEWDRALLEPQLPIWSAFFRERLADETYIAFIAEDDTATVGSGALLIHLAIPVPDILSDRAGRVQSLYVVPQARHKGIAHTIMERILSYAREMPLIALSLRPSDEARLLYENLGFETANEMILRLD